VGPTLVAVATKFGLGAEIQSPLPACMSVCLTVRHRAILCQHDPSWDRDVQARREGVGRGEVFPGPATFWGGAIAQNTEKGLPDGFFLTLNVHKIQNGFCAHLRSERNHLEDPFQYVHKIHFRPGLRPGPRGREGGPCNAPQIP